VFSSQLSFVKHMKTQHHVVEIESTSPILAEVQIQRADSVGSNTKRHPGEKRFQCGQCSKRFPTSKDLKRHDVVHTGNREFQCSYCSHRFGRKDHRMRHEKKTHASEMLSSSPLSPSNNSKDSSTVLVKRETEAAERRRWRHLSSPSVASSTAPADFEMTEWPIRIRAMSTCEQRMDGPLYSESSLKYLESQLSPDSLLMEDVALDASSLSPDFSSVKEESEETCLSHGSDENTRNDLDWIMADFMIKTEVGEQPSASDSSPTAVAVSNLADLLSPASPDTTTTDSSQLTPEPSSLSPPGLYPPDVIPPDPTVVDALAAASIGDSSKPVQQLRCPKQLMSDILTRTKNPVLPSVYIDSALIVPEPSKQKYHNPHPLLSPEDMDDYYEAFIDDDKEIRENILDMLN
jgi:DNA-directed RNA polymerase subunit RPC12/RpoP